MATNGKPKGVAADAVNPEHVDVDDVRETNTAVDEKTQRLNTNTAGAGATGAPTQAPVASERVEKAQGTQNPVDPFAAEKAQKTQDLRGQNVPVAGMAGNQARHESVQAESVRAERRSPLVGGLKSKFNGLKTSVASTADAAKVMGRLTPKQLKDEVQIAKLEMIAKGKALGKGAAVAGVGLFFGLIALIALVSAAIHGLGQVMPTWLAALLLALAFLILMAILAFAGYKMIMKQMPLKPESALFNVLYDLGVLKHGSDMTSSRVKREQAEKAREKEEKKAAKAEAEKQKEGHESTASTANQEQLELRTKQRREHLKSLRDDVDTYGNNAKADAKGLVDGAKTSAANIPHTAADGSRRLVQNASDTETLKARWGSFATLAASISAFFVFLGKLIRRK